MKEQINKIKNWTQFFKENTDFSLNNDNVKNYTWISRGEEHSIKYHLSYDIFRKLYVANLLGGEFDNIYGHGKTEKDAVESLKLRLIQLRNKRNKDLN